MTVYQREFMHGAALAAIADADGFTALNRAADKHYGHYIVNADRHIFIKYTLANGPEFVFSFSDTDKLEISAVAGVSKKVFAVFVCNDVAITSLSVDELSKVIDLHKPIVEQVRIVAEPGKQLWFSGPQGEVPYAVPRNAFPQSILS